MITKIDNTHIEIKGNKNTFSIPYIKENIDFLIPVIKEIVEFNKEHYSKYIKYNTLTLTPYDFYNYSHASPNSSQLLITQNEYYGYQIYNLLLLPESEEDAIKKNWEKQNEEETRFHNIGKKGYKNKKYLKKDIHGGYLEAVYDEQGQIVLNHINDGTYNFYHQSPLHSIDVILWLIYGVLIDQLSMDERVTILKSNLEQIYNFM